MFDITRGSKSSSLQNEDERVIDVDPDALPIVSKHSVVDDKFSSETHGLEDSRVGGEDGRMIDN